MPGSVTHIAIADKVYNVLGGNVIQNLPLFFGGSIAPDAIHAKADYQRADKKRAHFCDGIHLYGYGHPKSARLFQNRVKKFVGQYFIPGGVDKELYLGYAVHLLADEF